MPPGTPFAIAAVLGCALAACSSTDGGQPVDRANGTAVAGDTLLPESTGGSATAGDPVAAAVRYVASTDELMAHSPVGRREIFRTLVTPSALSGQVVAFERAAATLAETMDVPVERLVWVEAPLTATLVDLVDEEASVDVWTVSILGAADADSPQQVWRTVHVDLGFVGGDWLVDAATADSGPTPAMNELALQSDWDDFAEVAGWPAVVEGAGL